MGSLENPFFRKGGGGGVTKKTIHIGELPTKGAWAVCRFKGGGLAKESNALYVDY